jgi:hypothetical protein
MTIEDPGDTFFPYNAIVVIENTLRPIDADLGFIRRRIMEGDPDQTVAVVPVNAEPSDPELGKTGPTTQEYTIYVQTLIVDSDIERGLRTHSYFAKRVRDVLAWYKPLHIALGMLKTSDGPVTEETTSLTVGSQIFHNLEMDDGNWNWLSTTDISIATQQSKSS